MIVRNETGKYLVVWWDDLYERRSELVGSAEEADSRLIEEMVEGGFTGGFTLAPGEEREV